MLKKKPILSIFVLVIIMSGLLIAQTEERQDLWMPFKFFVGKWEGKGEGKSGISKVTHEFQFVLNGKYLQMKTKAVFEPQEKNPKGEIHEDIGLISYDKMRKKFVFRQFHVEGFINQYVLESIPEGGKTFTFVSEQIENGPPGLKAKVALTILNDAALEVSFHLAFPGREFDCYSVNTLKRKKEKEVESERSELVQPAKWWKNLPRPIYASLEKIETSQEWFEVYKLTEGTYAIYEPYQFEEAISYLVLGKEKAVVIDTGTGIGDLKQAVKELTDLPVSVVNTHTHWDHIGDNHQFDEILCFNNSECTAKLIKGVANARLQRSITGDSIWKPLPKDFDSATWEIPSVKPTSLLEDGDVIELGRRALEVIYTPGHSPGSICLLDKKNRVLFTGDTFFPGPLYAYPEDVNLEDYIVSIDKIKNRLDEYDYICSGHNDPWVKSEVISRVAQAFQDIMAGKGQFKEDGNIRRYYFDGFDILIRTDMIKQ